MKIFERYKIDSIKLNDEAIDYLDRIIENIDKQSKLILSMNRKPLFIDRLSNILLLSLKAKKQLKNKSLLYEIAIKYSLVNNSRYRDINTLLNLLSFQLREENVILPFITNITQLNVPSKIDYDEIGNTAFYYYLVNANVQTDIFRCFKSQSLGCDAIAELVIKYNIPIFDSDLLKEYINKLRIAEKIYDFEYSVYALFYTFEKISDLKLKKIIQEYSNECELLKFLMLPREYPIEQIDIAWLRFCKNEDLKSFFTNDISRKKLKEYIDEGKEYADFLKKKVWNLL